MAEQRQEHRATIRSGSAPERIWTIAEAKVRLTEILRLAEEEGPQQIGGRNAFVVVPKREWERLAKPRMPLGQWLVANMPRGIELELPDRKNEPEREIPFQGDGWDWGEQE